MSEGWGGGVGGGLLMDKEEKSVSRILSKFRIRGLACTRSWLVSE